MHTDAWTKAILRNQACTSLWLTHTWFKQLATREMLYQWLSFLINIESCYKRNGLQWWFVLLVLIICFIRISCQYKMVCQWIGMLTNIKYAIKRTGSKVGCFVGFYHHYLVTMSVHIHVYRYPFFESGMRKGLQTINLNRKDLILVCK